MKFTYWKLRNKIFIITILVLLISSFIVYFTIYQYSTGDTTVTIEYESDIFFAVERITIDKDFLVTHMYTDENREEITYKLQLTESDVKNIFTNFVIRGYFLNFYKYTSFITKSLVEKRPGYPGNSYFTIVYNDKTKTIGGYNAFYKKSFSKYYYYLIRYIEEKR